MNKQRKENQDLKINYWLRCLFRKKHKTDEEIHSEKITVIVKHLHRVKNKLVALLPLQFQAHFERVCYVSGGSIYSLYHNQTPKDYDFLVTKMFPVDDLREYFIEQCGYHGDSIHGGTYKNLPLLVTDNAISIGKYQIITGWIGEPEETIGEFDFRHNQCYWQGDDDVHCLSDWKYIKGNELVYNEKRARDIVGTIMRVPRFISRGMKINQKELSKMLLRLHEVGFNERELKILNNAKSDKHFGS